MAKPNYYLIANLGTYLNNPYVKYYPYQLVLAQIYYSSREYRDSIRDMKERAESEGRDLRLILDNGAHEGVSLDPQIYQEVVKDLRPDVVVLPDKIGEPHYESRNYSMLFGSWIQLSFPKMEMMYVPQGRNKDEILAEFQWAYLGGQLPKNAIVGWGQSYLTWEVDGLKDEDARFRLMADVSKLMSGREIQHRSHILGARWNPRNFGSFYTYFNVVGMDTIKPVTCTLQGTLYPSRKFNKTELESYASADIDDLIENVKTLCDMYGLRDWMDEAVTSYAIGD